LVSSTFARQPLLAVLLMAGLLVAFGALVLRLQDVLFGAPKGPKDPVKASYVPLFLHLALVLVAGVWLPGHAVGWFRAVAALPGRGGAFPSLGRHHAPAIRLERTICDLYGFAATDAPDPRRWLDHGAWGVRAPLGEKNPTVPRDPTDYDFRPVHGEGLHQ